MSKEEQPYEEVTTGQEQPKKKGLIEEIQEMKASGNTQSPEFKAKIKELEVILGVPQLSPFKTNELDIFEDDLKAMDVTDMMRMAKEAGLNPVLDKPRMKSLRRIPEIIAGISFPSLSSRWSLTLIIPFTLKLLKFYGIFNISV